MLLAVRRRQLPKWWMARTDKATQPATGTAPTHVVAFRAPSFLSFFVTFALFAIVGTWSVTRVSEVTALSWYVSIAWTVPIALSAYSMVGAARTKRQLEASTATYSTISVDEALVVVLPTVARADTYPALERVVSSIRLHFAPVFKNLRIDVIVEQDCEAMTQVTQLALRETYMELIVVPGSYQTANRTLFKARANQYALEMRAGAGENRDDVWLLHMDDDTAVGADTARQLGGFISAQRLEKNPRHLAQGVLTYPREHAPNRLTWMADAVRPACDISFFAMSTGSGTPRMGLHGELLLVRASVESLIGWDFGPSTIVEDAEFALRFSEMFPDGSEWIPACCYGASPATVGGFVRQRERWLWGLIRLARTDSISRRTRARLIHNVLVWSLSPFVHPLFVLGIGALIGTTATRPVGVFLVPFWAFNIAFAVWLYWAGLRINQHVSAESGPARWERLAIVPLIPILSLLEVAGTIAGLIRVATRAHTQFTVIAKPR